MNGLAIAVISSTVLAWLGGSIFRVFPVQVVREGEIDYAKVDAFIPGPTRRVVLSAAETLLAASGVEKVNAWLLSAKRLAITGEPTYVVELQASHSQSREERPQGFFSFVVSEFGATLLRARAVGGTQN